LRNEPNFLRRERTALKAASNSIGGEFIEREVRL
jgi:hypothetical protein